MYFDGTFCFIILPLSRMSSVERGWGTRSTEATETPTHLTPDPLPDDPDPRPTIPDDPWGPTPYPFENTLEPPSAL